MGQIALLRSHARLAKNGSKVKAAIKAAGCNSSGDVIPALNGMVMWYIEQAAKRAQANGRKTVRGHDIVSM